MGVITRAYSEVDGQIGEASSVNRVIDDLYTLQAGNLDGSNIAGSGILAANLANSSVLERVLANSSVSSRTIVNQAVDFNALDYQVILAKEVFS